MQTRKPRVGAHDQLPVGSEGPQARPDRLCTRTAQARGKARQLARQVLERVGLGGYLPGQGGYLIARAGQEPRAFPADVHLIIETPGHRTREASAGLRGKLDQVAPIGLQGQVQAQARRKPCRPGARSDDNMGRCHGGAIVEFQAGDVTAPVEHAPNPRSGLNASPSGACLLFEAPQDRMNIQHPTAGEQQSRLDLATGKLGVHRRQRLTLEHAIRHALGGRTAPLPFDVPGAAADERQADR